MYKHCDPDQYPVLMFEVPTMGREWRYYKADPQLAAQLDALAKKMHVLLLEEAEKMGWVVQTCVGKVWSGIPPAQRLEQVADAVFRVNKSHE